MRQNVLRALGGLRTGVGRDALRAALSGQAAGAASAECASAARCLSSLRALASMSKSAERFTPSVFSSFSLSQTLSKGISTSAHALAEPLTEVAVEGDAESLIKQLDIIVSSENVTAKDVADAAVALTYLQAKGNRRIWGKVLEKAATLKSSFDAASLTNLLWAITTANVEHFKTVYELAGPASSLLSTLTSTQLSVVVEALGKAGVSDAEFFSKVSTTVSAKVGDYKAPELARLLWGFAAAGVLDVKLIKAVGAALLSKSGELGSREAAQALWSLAALRRADKALVDGLVKALKGKGVESPADAAAAAWALGTLNHKPDNATGKALADALKSGAGDLSPTQAIQSAWGLGLIGAGDKDSVGALFAVAAAAIDKAPDALDIPVLGALHAAHVLTPDAALAPNVASYVEKVFGLAVDHERSRRGTASLAFRADLAEAVARATGARYRPEVVKAVKGFSRPAPDGSTLDIAVDVDKDTKVVIEAVEPSGLTSNTPYQVLGSVTAIAKVREAQGFKVVLISSQDWAELKDSKAKAAHVLSAVRKAVPSASSRLDSLQKKLNEPFDAYAE